MTGNLSEDLWQCFAVVSKAGNEAETLLDEITDRISARNFEHVRVEHVDSDFSQHDNGSEWVCFSDTRNFKVIPSRKHIPTHVLAVQIVFSSENGSKAGAKSILNVMLVPWDVDDKKDNYWNYNYLDAHDEEYWEDIRLSHEGKLFYSNQDFENMERAFSLPIHAISCPDDIAIKIIEPITALLNNPNIEDLDDGLFEDALKFTGKGFDIHLDE